MLGLSPSASAATATSVVAPISRGPTRVPCFTHGGSRPFISTSGMGMAGAIRADGLARKGPSLLSSSSTYGLFSPGRATAIIKASAPTPAHLCCSRGAIIRGLASAAKGSRSPKSAPAVVPRPAFPSSGGLGLGTSPAFGGNAGGGRSAHRAFRPLACAFCALRAANNSIASRKAHRGLRPNARIKVTRTAIAGTRGARGTPEGTRLLS